jgi:hypothetical protein
LYPDESLNYFIPLEDIVLDGVQYNENYTNGQRRNLELKLINTVENDNGSQYKQNTSSRWIPNYYYDKIGPKYECLVKRPNNWDTEYASYYVCVDDNIYVDGHKHKYFPNVNGLWYGTKIKYE